VLAHKSDRNVSPSICRRSSLSRLQS
jgi:hypothetical protein